MVAATKHLDEARSAAVEAMTQIANREKAIAAAVIIDDLFGRISVVLWLESPHGRESIVHSIATALEAGCAQYWTGTIAVSDAAQPGSDTDLVHVTAWHEGTPTDDLDRVRLNDRYRHHTGWLARHYRSDSAGNAIESGEQLWSQDDGPPIIVFHGFKGGAGRTTLLASYALSCARRSKRVAVVDMDLDAPGIGWLLAADADGTTARWGTIDFLLEANHDLPLSDYFHVFRNEVVGDGLIEVVPAGALDDAYLSKLGRVDLDVRTDVRAHALAKLLRRIRNEINPDVILLDGRAGLSPAAGLLLSGLAHLHILVATSNVQSLRGLERVVRHLGFEQARRDIPQAECVVVHAHVPDSSEAARVAREHFSARVEEFFRNGYYSQVATDDDRTWSLRDLDSKVAPHVPVAISYRGRLAHFETIDDIASLLVSDPDYVALHQRIDERLGESNQLANTEGEDMVDG